MQKYYSKSGTIKTRRRRRRDNYYEQLAVDTFKAFAPYVNLLGCGEKINYFSKQENKEVCHPVPFLKKSDWQRMRQYLAWKEDNSLPYPKLANGKPFQPKHFFMKQVSWKHVLSAMNGWGIYYTSNPTSGRALICPDIDAHEGQTDKDKALELFRELTGDKLFNVESERGHHPFLKVNWTGYTLYRLNQVGKEHGVLLQAYMELRGIQSNVDGVKGTIASNSMRCEGKYGLMMRLPVGIGWTKKTLEEFKQTPEVSLQWLMNLNIRLREEIARLNKITPQPDKPKQKRRGSIAGWFLNDAKLQELHKVKQSFRNHSYYLWGILCTKKPNSRKRIVRDDIDGLYLVYHLARRYLTNQFHKNEIPSGWIEDTWNRLYRAGLISRACDFSRVTLIRTIMIKTGIVKMIDNTYWFGGAAGELGKAMQYTLKPEFDVEVDSNGCIVNNRARERETYTRTEYPIFIESDSEACCIPVFDPSHGKLHAYLSKFQVLYDPDLDAKLHKIFNRAEKICA